jgi:hypothetical protein
MSPQGCIYIYIDMFASEKRVIRNSKYNLINKGTKNAQKLGHAGSVTTNYISPEDDSIYPSKNVEGCRQKLGDVA